jgi:hypothetical protein
MANSKESEPDRFEAALDKILSVSHEELKRREEEWKKQRKTKGHKRVRA